MQQKYSDFNREHFNINNQCNPKKKSLITKSLQGANCLSSLLCLLASYSPPMALAWFSLSLCLGGDLTGSGMVAHVAVTLNMMWWEWRGGTEKRGSCIIKKSVAIRDIYTVEWLDQTIPQILTYAAVLMGSQMHTYTHSTSTLWPQSSGHFTKKKWQGFKLMLLRGHTIKQIAGFRHFQVLLVTLYL